MPIYEYKCPECGIISELEWKNRDTIPQEIICPACGIPAQRKFSSFQFGFSPYLKELREGNMVDY